MKYEMRKLVRQMHVKGALLLVLVLCAAWGIVSVGAYRSRAETGGTAYLKGKAAFENDRKKYAQVRGDITEEKLNEALWDIQSCKDESTAYLKAVEQYPGLGSLLDQRMRRRTGILRCLRWKARMIFMRAENRRLS